ncbi:hypothetical protein ACFVU0_11765 [Streptomyces sp. NPDC058122]|uniref:hypothetical protein n=1 Tax=Streptomyces sp. NPDC058122 TaxID=3346349 RepID=UPI0036E4359B
MTTPAFAAQAESLSNATYLGNQLKYSIKVDGKLSGVVDPSDLQSFLKRARWAFMAAVIFMIPVALLLVLITQSVGGAIPALFVPLLASLATFFIPSRQGLSEWQLVVDGKGAAADSAYGVIYQVIRTRQLPVSVVPRRFRTAHDPTIKNFLVITDREYQAYVSVFAYGTGLYVGWSLWSSRRPMAMFGRFLKDSLSSPFKGQSEFKGQISSQRARALREAVHSAVREGIDAANHDLHVPLSQTFGHDIPVETVNTPQAAPVAPAAPAAWPGAAQPPAPFLPPAPASPPAS